MNSPENLTGIATFVTTARSSSFTQAAERLGVSKSAVGKSIASLEARLGIKLFHRTTRKLTLTVDGEAYFVSCANALDEIGSAEAALKSGHHRPSGRLRIDMPASFGRRVLLPVLLNIAEIYPDLQLTATFTDHLVDPIEEGVDLTIRFGELKDSTGLVARQLTRQKLVMCAAPRYLMEHGEPLTLDDLNEHQCILGYRRGQPLGWNVSDAGGSALHITPPATHQFDDGDAILSAALAGRGICQLPLSMVRESLGNDRLQAVLVRYSGQDVSVHAVWPSTRHLLPKVRFVVDELVRRSAAGALD